ncbi:hypothetical protein LINPERHAP2_LOCUS11670 [Linum perenne]
MRRVSSSRNCGTTRLSCKGQIQLLAAIGVDGNENIFPIAWAVVERECENSWGWFMELLKGDLEIPNAPGWMFMSDRQKGLQNVMERRFSYDEHRYCARPICVNFSDKFSIGAALWNMFWAVCKATNKVSFNEAIHTFREKGDKYMTPEGQTPPEWMQRSNIQSWCKYYFETLTACERSLNNHCESFNQQILEARDMPIL